jgi:hypothetical protein
LTSLDAIEQNFDDFLNDCDSDEEKEKKADVSNPDKTENSDEAKNSPTSQKVQDDDDPDKVIDLTYLTADKEEDKKESNPSVRTVEKKLTIDGEEVVMNEVEYETPLESLIALASIFLEARDELNLTAAHYVLDIFSSLLKCNQTRVDFMQWLFSDSSYTQYLSRHAGETCVIDFIKKVLNMP